MTRYLTRRLATSLLFRVTRRYLPFIALLLLLRFAFALEITVLDVNQGTAVLIQAPTGQTVLYDAGPEPSITRDLQALGVQHINLAIGSHAHADHIGGMAEVLNTYKPPMYMDNSIAYGTRTYQRTLEAALAIDAQLLEPTRRILSLGDVTLTIVPPPLINTDNQNNNSIGVRIDYGEFSAFLPGDAEPEQWEWWLNNHPDLLTPVNIHLSSHHGSRHGDTQAGINALQPDVVIISLGANNTYGHPHVEALRLYHQVNANVYRTDHNGHIQIKANPDGTYVLRSPPQAAAQPLTTTASATNNAAAQQTTECINLNTATQEELQRIIHVGPARATAIINMRAAEPFNTIDDLNRINGIGSGRLNDIKNQGSVCRTTKTSTAEPD